MSDKIGVSEIFSSIQGEGPNTGVPSIFIRLAGCNLACSWCFVGNTLVYTPNGQKRIDSVKEGDAVYGFDHSDGVIKPAKVSNIFSSEVSSSVVCLVEAGGIY